MEEIQPDVPSLQVSVLIVSHNSESHLRRCLEAIERSQSRETIEVLVVDNGSRDACASIDSDFPNVTVLRLPRHFGLTKARNIGVRTAKAPLVLLLSPEVEVEPNTIAALATRLEEDPSALAVAPMLIDTAGQPVSESRRLPNADVLSSCWRSGVPGDRVMVAPGETLPVELHDGRALLVRRQSLRSINYLDERFGESWSDADLAYQIRRAGKKILLIGDIRGTVREPLAPSDAPAFEADRASGAVAYAGKHFGFASGLGLRLKIAFGALFSGRPGLFLQVLEGRKIDGNDPSL